RGGQRGCTAACCLLPLAVIARSAATTQRTAVSFREPPRADEVLPVGAPGARDCYAAPAMTSGAGVATPSSRDRPTAAQPRDDGKPLRPLPHPACRRRAAPAAGSRRAA